MFMFTVILIVGMVMMAAAVTTVGAASIACAEMSNNRNRK